MREDPPDLSIMALKAMAQTIARNHAAEGVLSYIVAPGVVRTRMSEQAATSRGGEEALTATLAMREWVPPSDVAALVVFLATGRARHLTGATLEACARVLKEKGAREVRTLTAARVATGQSPIRHQ